MNDEFAAYRRSTGGISYIDVGQGPVTLFVHGVFTNGRLWRNCVRSLSENRRCISIDLPGHGHTRPVGEASVPWAEGGFEQLLGDVTSPVFDVYGDDTVIYPGRGDDTTLGAERPHLTEWRERGW